MTKSAGIADIIAAVRTPIGTARKGALANVSAADLAKPVVSEAIARSALEGAQFDDLLLAEVYQGGGDIARFVAVDAGLTGLPGVALNRQCASSLTAIALGAGQIAAGMSTALLAGGTESLSTAPMSRKRKAFTAGNEAGDFTDPWFSESHPGTDIAPSLDMSITVGHNCATRYGITREDQDAWALRSHQRAIAAIDSGLFAEEIVTLNVEQGDGTSKAFDQDEHPRRGTKIETLAGLRVLHPEIDGFTVTAGNSSGLNDAASVVALTAPGRTRAPLATVLSWSYVGVAPEDTGSAPIEAIPKALDRAGLALGDVTVFEINEAFAAQAVACTRALGLAEDNVNVYGSGISLGHPIAATGARMVTSLIYELRRRGGGIGVASMCAGGGMGAAMVLRVD